jgi:hypothetical protein
MVHRSFKSIVAASTNGIWDGIQVRQGPDEYCVHCKIGGIAKANRGHKPPDKTSKPGEVLFMDIIPNPAKGGLTSSTSYRDYLIIADAYSLYFTFIGLKTTASTDIIEALKTFIVYHWPYPDYTTNDINEIHQTQGRISPQKN